ncbi:hypothetical protein HY994_06380, partial [Candidatus Micrarchaeota archaeon]|nr:hypothetical protein [Candidatus Micrarchaeota archaeon]
AYVFFVCHGGWAFFCAGRPGRDAQAKEVRKSRTYAFRSTYKTKPLQKFEPRGRGIFGAGTIIAGGDDVCRHKAAMLVQCLQEAGIETKYVRGDIRAGLAGGRHAWVHAKLDGTWYRLDPQWDILKPLKESEAVKIPTRDNPLYTPDINTNVVWRRKRRA